MGRSNRWDQLLFVTWHELSLYMGIQPGDLLRFGLPFYPEPPTKAYTCNMTRGPRMIDAPVVLNKRRFRRYGVLGSPQRADTPLANFQHETQAVIDHVTPRMFPFRANQLRDMEVVNENSENERMHGAWYYNCHGNSFL